MSNSWTNRCKTLGTSSSIHDNKSFIAKTPLVKWFQRKCFYRFSFRPTWLPNYVLPNHVSLQSQLSPQWMIYFKLHLHQWIGSREKHFDVFHRSNVAAKPCKLWCYTYQTLFRVSHIFVSANVEIIACSYKWQFLGWTSHGKYSLIKMKKKNGIIIATGGMGWHRHSNGWCGMASSLERVAFGNQHNCSQL